MIGCKRFLKDESGAVTVDWVVLTAGLAILATLAMLPIRGALGDASVFISDTIAEYKVFLE
jgi:Flp pilus assembly pilin Flp